MEKEIRYKVLTTPAIQKLAEDLKDRVNNFMQHAFRNEETAKVVDFTLANTFLHSLEQSMQRIGEPALIKVRDLAGFELKPGVSDPYVYVDRIQHVKTECLKFYYKKDSGEEIKN